MTRSITNQIISKHLTSEHLKRLQEIPESEWPKLIAKAAGKTGGKTSYNQKAWLKHNTRDHSVGAGCIGHCGVASWLFAAVKNQTTRQKHSLQYYFFKGTDKKQSVDHVTVLCPDGREVDVTAPQHEVTLARNYKEVKPRLLTLRKIERDRKTLKRFTLFMAAVRQVLDEEKRFFKGFK